MIVRFGFVDFFVLHVFCVFCDFIVFGRAV